MTRITRQGRVYNAMLGARMLIPDIAPPIRDVRAFLALPDPGYDEGSLESARHYACVGLMEQGPNPYRPSSTFKKSATKPNATVAVM